MTSLSQKTQVCIFIEEAVFCPVTYVRLIIHLRREIPDFDFRIFQVGRDLDLVLRSINSFDILILARSVTQASYEVATKAHQLNIPIVFDIDDYLWKLPEYLGSQDRSLELDRIINLADLITTPSLELQKYLKKKWPEKPIKILPNPGELNEEPPRLNPLIGVIANSDIFRLPQMRKEFFESINNAANNTNQPVLLYYFSNDVPNYFSDEVNLKIVFMGIRSYSSYREILSWLKPDFALIGLPDDHFSRYKSVIKFAEFSAIRCVGIYSDVEPYRSYVRHGVDGYLVPNTKYGWQNGLEQFMRLSPDQRDKLKQSAYNRGKEEFTLSKITYQFIENLKAVRRNTTKGLNSLDNELNLPDYLIPKDRFFLLQESYKNITERLDQLTWYHFQTHSIHGLLKLVWRWLKQRLRQVLRNSSTLLKKIF